MCTIYKLENTIREYAWGSKTAFSLLFDNQDQSSEPQAELWMGAHPNAPSLALVGNEKVPLTNLIEQKPTEFLGEYTTKKFESKLPFLLKIIASEKPLSIQVHPDSFQAKEGFAREETASLPQNSPDRTYHDPNHKPELICALTPFWALYGFRNYAAIIDSFTSIENKSIASKLEEFRKNQTDSGLRRFYEYVMRSDEKNRKALIGEIVSIAESSSHADPVHKWILSVHTEFPFDIGIASFYFLNIIRLNPEEALFLPARLIHSYLNGIGVEIMANSDNVVRGGLTEKHVDTNELLSILDFSASKPIIISPIKIDKYEKSFGSHTAEFELSRISLNKGETYYNDRKRSIEIIIVVDGNGKITDNSKKVSLDLNKGTSFVIPACVSRYTIEGKITLFKAFIPIPKS